MPKIVADIPNLNTHSHSIVTLKVCACTLPLVPVLCNHSTYSSLPFFLILQLLSSHYEYFARYYGSGMLDRTCLGLASEEEKTCSALVVYRLLDTLSEKVQCDIQVTLPPTTTLTLAHMNTISEEFSSAISPPHQLPSNLSLLRSSTSCLRAVSSALGPDCLVPSRLLMASMYKSSTSTYEPRPVDTSHVVLSPELTDFVRSFASFQHDCWTHEKVSVLKYRLYCCGYDM